MVLTVPSKESSDYSAAAWDIKKKVEDENENKFEDNPGYWRIKKLFDCTDKYSLKCAISWLNPTTLTKPNKPGTPCHYIKTGNDLPTALPVLHLV